MTTETLFSPHAESALLGGLLILAAESDTRQAAEVCVGLSSADFHSPLHGLIFNTIAEQVEDGQPFDLITLDGKLEKQPTYQEWGLPYLVDLHQNTPGTSNLRSYASTLRDKSKLRQIISKLQKAHSIMVMGEGNTQSKLDACNDLLTDLSQADTSERQHLVSARDAAKSYVRNLEWIFENPGQTGLTTGLTDLDARFAGWKAGELIIVAARPGAGKTTMSTAVALHNGLEHSKHTLFFSLEMPITQLVQRMTACLGRVPINTLKDASALGDQNLAHKVTGAIGRYSQANIRIDETPSLDVADLRARARAAAREEPVDLIVIDYLQLLTDRQYRSDRFQEVSAISRKLKALAKELSCVVMCLSQLSRKCEERSDKRPISSDLRESGQLEQDADAILMLYRDEIYNPDSERKGIMEVITTKFRDGEPGTDCIKFIGAENRLEDATFVAPLAQPVTSRKGFGGFA